MAEWFKALVLKTIIHLFVSRVRIPFYPIKNIRSNSLIGKIIIFKIIDMGSSPIYFEIFL